MKQVIVDRYYGLGDQLYKRPFVKKLAEQYDEVYLCTPFPELYWDDYRIKFFKPSTDLKTQAKNINELPGEIWSVCPKNAEQIHPCYHDYKIKKGYSILRSFSQDFKVDITDFKLPINPNWISEAKKILPNDRPVCIVKFPTCRTEWHNFSRNPKMEYINHVIDKSRRDYHFISIADNSEGKEWFDGTPTAVDACYNNGQIHWTTILGMIALSDMVLCGPCFVMLAAIALKAKCLCLFGGSIKPEILFDERYMDFENFRYVAPDPFCNCIQNEHKECNKELNMEEIMINFYELGGL